MKIAVIGSSNVDFITKLDRLPKPGETVGQGEYMVAFGGKGANQAVAASKSGGDVLFLSVLGNDTHGKEMKDSFSSAGMDTSIVETTEDVPTGCASIFVDKNGGNMIAVAPGANDKLTAEVVDRHWDAISKCQLVVLQYEIPSQTVSHVIAQCAKDGIDVMFNLAPAAEFPKELLSSLKYLVVNETEAEFLTGTEVSDELSAKSVGQELLSSGCEFVIITLGAKGSYVCSEEISEFVASHRVEAVDSTAAGDTYCGALAAAISEGTPVLEAVKFASAAAAISVTRFGAQPSVPTKDEILSLMQETV